MKKRSLLLMAILYLFTGIYSLYWYIKFQMELKKATGKGFGGLGHFLMTILTLGIYYIYWQYAAGKRLAKLGASDLSVIYLILFFTTAGALTPFIMQAQANGVAKK